MHVIYTILLGVVFLTSTNFAIDASLSEGHKVPDLTMPDNNLTFKMIEGYQNYKLISTHYRTDKSELRYVLINTIGYNALLEKRKTLPKGTKVVKIGWTTKKMATFPSALEKDTLQRVEYMVKDPDTFNNDGDHWGYARFVKTKEGYKSWDKGTQSCISCHKTAEKNDYLFTNLYESNMR